jgi:predicted DNA-binding transcriptional regulator AlpA
MGAIMTSERNGLLSITAFCQRHGIGRSTYFVERKNGNMPDEVHIGSRPYISPQAEAEWIERLERPAREAREARDAREAAARAQVEVPVLTLQAPSTPLPQASEPKGKRGAAKRSTTKGRKSAARSRSSPTSDSSPVAP